MGRHPRAAGAQSHHGHGRQHHRRRDDPFPSDPRHDLPERAPLPGGQPG